MSTRIERPKRSGVSPSAARKPTLLDDWDVIRAAQHMIEVHGNGALQMAQGRAEVAGELKLMKRWNAIAQTIQTLQRAESGRG